MGENEMGSLLRTIIAVSVFGLIVTFFAGILITLIVLSNGIHDSAYGVN